MSTRVVTLAEAMEHAATAVYLCRQKWGDEVFDAAVKHHTARRLRADVEAGTTTDTVGVRSRFADYDWAATYTDAPHFVWFDFFRGEIENSCSRIQRGLAP